MKTYSWPKNHWNWPIKLSHQHGVRCGGLIFTGGQADLDSNGNVVNPDDLALQTKNVLSHVENIVNDLDGDFHDVVRLVVYFVGDATTENTILELIAGHLNTQHPPVVSTIMLPALCYPGMLIELEAVAIDRREHAERKSVRLETLPALHGSYAHVIRCGDLVFTSDMSAISANGEIVAANDLIRQTTIMMEQLVLALEAVGASTDDVLKLNVFYKGDGTADNWLRPAQIRAGYFAEPGPAATGMTVEEFAQTGLTTKIAVTAGTGETQYSWPQGHWNWTSPLPYKHANRHGQLIHLGGQVALDINAAVLHPDDIVAQTRIALNYIETLLQDLGASFDDVLKVTTFYQGSASAEELHKNLSIRSAAFKTPGPATTGIPVPHLVYEHMMIEIEVIAMVS